VDPASDEDISEVKNATLSDSLAYFMGQSAAATYWQQCESDSTIAGAENVKKFQEGFAAGLKQMQENRAYAAGYLQAVMVSEDIRGINENMKLKLDPNRLAQGFNRGMKGKDAVDPVKLRASMQILESRVGTIMQQQGAQAPQQAMGTVPGADALLKKAADEGGATQATKSGIRYKIENPGQGATPVQGDLLTVSIAFKDLNGNIVQTTKNGDTEYMTFPLTPNDVPYQAMMEVFETLRPGGRGIYYVPENLGEGRVGAHILDVKLQKVSKP